MPITPTQNIDLSFLSKYFHLPINVVAKEIGVCATVLKKICRKNGIPRWPHRKIKSIDKMISNLESSIPKSPEEITKIEAEITTLKKKKNYLIKNPNILVMKAKKDVFLDNDFEIENDLSGSSDSESNESEILKPNTNPSTTTTTTTITTTSTTPTRANFSPNISIPLLNNIHTDSNLIPQPPPQQQHHNLYSQPYPQYPHQHYPQHQLHHQNDNYYCSFNISNNNNYNMYFQNSHKVPIYNRNSSLNPTEIPQHLFYNNDEFPKPTDFSNMSTQPVKQKIPKTPKTDSEYSIKLPVLNIPANIQSPIIKPLEPNIMDLNSYKSIGIQPLKLNINSNNNNNNNNFHPNNDLNVNRYNYTINNSIYIKNIINSDNYNPTKDNPINHTKPNSNNNFFLNDHQIPINNDLKYTPFQYSFQGISNQQVPNPNEILNFSLHY